MNTWLRLFLALVILACSGCWVRLTDRTPREFLRRADQQYEFELEVRKGDWVRSSSIDAWVWVDGVRHSMEGYGAGSWTYLHAAEGTPCFEYRYDVDYGIWSSKDLPRSGEFHVPVVETTTTAEQAQLADWIRGLQFVVEDQDAYGAIKLRHSPGHHYKPGPFVSIDYYKVSPYFVNLALLGLLEAPGDDRLEVVERWIDWYLGHLNMEATPPGVVWDHWYTDGGSGSPDPFVGDTNPSRPPGNNDDGSDSYAATLLGLAWAYYEACGNSLFLEGWKEELEVVAEVILQLQDTDGLTWAKADYPVKFLMDNSEVFWGLISVARLEAEVFGDESRSARYYCAAHAVRAGILGELYDPVNQLFFGSKDASGTRAPVEVDQWYPVDAVGVVALLWPHLFGVVEPDSGFATLQLEKLNERWDGTPNPDWSSSIPDPGNPFLWPSIAYAASLAGDGIRATAKRDHLNSLLWPSGDPYPDVSYAHFNVDDAGWLLRLYSRVGTD